MKKSTPRPPRDLSPEARKLWSSIAADYRIDDPHGCELLTNFMQCRDRVYESRAQIAKHGIVLLDRFGQLRPNPACQIERDARAGMLAALKALHLDIEPLRDIGRPPSSKF